METSFPLVSVIVLSYERPAFLAQALDSIVGQSYQNLEIIVVDNKSRLSDEIAGVVSEYDGVRLIRNNANLGYTGGMNRGLQVASGSYVHCTLDDVVLEQNCIRHLAEYIQDQPSAGLLSGILYNEDRETIRCAGGEFALLPVYRKKIFGAGEKEAGQFPEPYQVKYVPGGMIFSPLDLMKELNGFRREFFMYTEDTDLCARATKAGYSITVVPQAKVYHINAPYTFEPQGLAFHKTKNLFSLYLLHARLRVLPEFYLRYGVMNLLRALFSNRKEFWPMLKASGWFLINTPSLLRERYRGASL